jgi:hypothetical protein
VEMLLLFSKAIVTACVCTLSLAIRGNDFKMWSTSPPTFQPLRMFDFLQLSEQIVKNVIDLPVELFQLLQ